MQCFLKVSSATNITKTQFLKLFSFCLNHFKKVPYTVKHDNNFEENVFYLFAFQKKYAWFVMCYRSGFVYERYVKLQHKFDSSSNENKRAGDLAPANVGRLIFLLKRRNF